MKVLAPIVGLIKVLDFNHINWEKLAPEPSQDLHFLGMIVRTDLGKVWSAHKLSRNPRGPQHSPHILRESHDSTSTRWGAQALQSYAQWSFYNNMSLVAEGQNVPADFLQLVVPQDADNVDSMTMLWRGLYAYTFLPSGPRRLILKPWPPTGPTSHGFQFCFSHLWTTLFVYPWFRTYSQNSAVSLQPGGLMAGSNGMPSCSKAYLENLQKQSLRKYLIPCTRHTNIVGTILLNGAKEGLSISLRCL